MKEDKNLLKKVVNKNPFNKIFLKCENIEVDYDSDDMRDELQLLRDE